MNPLRQTLRRVIAAKHHALRLEDRFLRELGKLAAATAPRGRGLRKTLKCPKCERRFARPLHLGRHLSATHARRRRKAA